MAYNEEYLKDDNLNINWYPGHMKKTKELVQNNLKLVDLVIELIDARIPLSSRNPDIDRLVGDKSRILLLNKSDLVKKKDIDFWIEYYKSQGLKVIPINSMTGEGINKVVNECKAQTKDLMDSYIEKGRIARAIRLMIVGVPNVGKSSIINKLSGRKSTQTGDRPGVTKGKQWVKIRGDMELLDTPGILWPKFEDQEVALNLAFTRAIKDEILDVETLGLRLIERLIEIAPEDLMDRYKLNHLSDNPLDVMEEIGRKRGFILSGRELDYTRIAQTVLNEFREGKIGKICLEKVK
ncbi:ribosome biogenesis GTPase YlqF [Peptostreptococcus equinus]|uniref:Ribosome biogenesis GTPase A n=1 Tax=Peptostreptococcus equinus TaxID=3003601 RepID=A0ABY7JL96_9FIRM|nr:ribosome biogenesis GTPase YlqF [Peptostreptococcus sp. CBA3647]WAW14126.1 ribosome biogenesis GTPase YlqF [Peptostreptococcus sp. CBA3647]